MVMDIGNGFSLGVELVPATEQMMDVTIVAEIVECSGGSRRECRRLGRCPDLLVVKARVLLPVVLISPAEPPEQVT